MTWPPSGARVLPEAVQSTGPLEVLLLLWLLLLTGGKQEEELCARLVLCARLEPVVRLAVKRCIRTGRQGDDLQTTCDVHEIASERGCAKGAHQANQTKEEKESRKRRHNLL